MKFFVNAQNIGPRNEKLVFNSALNFRSLHIFCFACLNRNCPLPHFFFYIVVTLYLVYSYKILPYPPQRVGKIGFYGFCRTQLFCFSVKSVLFSVIFFIKFTKVYQNLPNFTKVYQNEPNAYQIVPNLSKFVIYADLSWFWIVVIYALFSRQMCISKKQGWQKKITFSNLSTPLWPFWIMFVFEQGFFFRWLFPLGNKCSKHRMMMFYHVKFIHVIFLLPTVLP